MKNYMDIKEFRKEGYLQEINRLFLHPMGLALEVKRDSDGNEILSGVWDCRHDNEGIAFTDNDSSDFIRRAKSIETIYQNRLKRRIKNLGYGIQPIDES